MSGVFVEMVEGKRARNLRVAEELSLLELLLPLLHRLGVLGAVEGRANEKAKC